METMFLKISAVTLDYPHEEYDALAALASISEATLRFPLMLAVRVLTARADGDGVCA